MNALHLSCQKYGKNIQRLKWFCENNTFRTANTIRIIHIAEMYWHYPVRVQDNRTASAPVRTREHFPIFRGEFCRDSGFVCSDYFFENNGEMGYLGN